MTPLRGVDGEVYAIAQGNLVVCGFGIAGQGRLEDLDQRAVRRPRAERRDGREARCRTASPPSRSSCST